MTLFGEHKFTRINGKHTGWVQQELKIQTDVFDVQYPLSSHGSSNSQELAGAQKLVPLFVWKSKQTLSIDTQLSKDEWLHGLTEHFDDERRVGIADIAIKSEWSSIFNTRKNNSYYRIAMLHSRPKDTSYSLSLTIENDLLWTKKSIFRLVHLFYISSEVLILLKAIVHI